MAKTIKFSIKEMRAFNRSIEIDYLKLVIKKGEVVRTLLDVTDELTILAIVSRIGLKLTDQQLDWAKGFLNDHYAGVIDLQTLIYCIVAIADEYAEDNKYLTDSVIHFCREILDMAYEFKKGSDKDESESKCKSKCACETCGCGKEVNKERTDLEETLHEVLKGSGVSAEAIKKLSDKIIKSAESGTSKVMQGQGQGKGRGLGVGVDMSGNIENARIAFDFANSKVFGKLPKEISDAGWALIEANNYYITEPLSREVVKLMGNLLLEG